MVAKVLSDKEGPSLTWSGRTTPTCDDQIAAVIEIRQSGASGWTVFEVWPACWYFRRSTRGRHTRAVVGLLWWRSYEALLAWSYTAAQSVNLPCIVGVHMINGVLPGQAAVDLNTQMLVCRHAGKMRTTAAWRHHMIRWIEILWSCWCNLELLVQFWRLHLSSPPLHFLLTLTFGL